MRRWAALFGFVAVLLAGEVAVAAPGTKEHPNIIMILSDDVGLGDIHCTGGSFNTPNIDSRP
jgi:hypothetical protein